MRYSKTNQVSLVQASACNIKVVNNVSNMEKRIDLRDVAFSSSGEISKELRNMVRSYAYTLQLVLSEAKNHFSLLEMAFMYRAILSESSQTTLKPVTLNSLVDRYYCDYKDSKSASQDLLWIGSFKKTISMNNFLRKLECFDSGYTYVLLEILTIFIRYNGQGKDISNLDENEVERIAITMAICEEIDLGAKYRSKLLKAINECVTY